ncbi:MAG: TonB-dependent receptor [Cyclobacteriaceae bacterium]
MPLIIRYAFMVACCLFCSSGFAQTLSGYVTDSTSGEPLAGVNVYLEKTLQGTASNAYGFFSLPLPEGNASVRFSFLGYESQLLKLSLSNDTLLNLRLSPQTRKLQGVEIRSAPNAVQSPQMGLITLRPQEMERIPTLAGEVDLIKVAQLLPGIQSGNEGSSDLIVRGGGPDQNLILLDGVPVYNVGHLLGLVSVFNTDAVKRVDITKGGFPARYGGRLSSVVDIQLKEGNTQEQHGAGAIGLLSGKLMLEGPIGKSGNTSYLVAARRTWLDGLLALGQLIADTPESGGYHFFDVNAKINHRFSERDRLFLSVYAGRDAFQSRYEDELEGGVQFQDQGSISWGNVTSALRWNHLFTPKLFGNLTATFSQYAFNVVSFSREETEENTVEGRLEYISRIRDAGLQMDFDYQPSARHSVKFGANATFHSFQPSATEYSLLDLDTLRLDSAFNGQAVQSLEGFAYLEDDISLTQRWRANVGLHLSGFLVENTFYRSLQPRISSSYLLNKGLSLKASYAQMTQFLHLLTNGGLGVPTDIWVPSTARIRPQQAWQAALGIEAALPAGLSLNVEAYYKEMEGVVDYEEAGGNVLDDPDGFLLGSAEDWQDKIARGRGEAYGLEVLLRRQQGRLSGWIGYTLSRSERQFAQLNQGRPFASPYDRPHDLSVVLMYQLAPRVSVGSNFVYASGRPVSLPMANHLPVNVYQVDDGKPRVMTSIDYFGERNSYRMPAYHRMDFSINFMKQKRWGERTWSLSVYNAYNRQNAYYWYVQGGSIQSHRRVSPRRQLYQVSLFSIIPTVSYRFKF